MKGDVRKMSILRKAAVIVTAAASAVSLAQPAYASSRSDIRNAEVRKARQYFSKKNKYRKSFEKILDTAETDFVIKYRKAGTKTWKNYIDVDSLSKGNYTFRLYGRASGALCGSATARLDDGSKAKKALPKVHMNKGADSFLGSIVSRAKKLVKKVKKNVKKSVSKTVNCSDP